MNHLKICLLKIAICFLPLVPIASCKSRSKAVDVASSDTTHVFPWYEQKESLQPFVGKWTALNEAYFEDFSGDSFYHINFLQDGNFSIDGYGGGTWSVSDDTLIHISGEFGEFGYGGGPFKKKEWNITFVEVEGDFLILRENSKLQQFVRIDRSDKPSYLPGEKELCPILKGTWERIAFSDTVGYQYPFNTHLTFKENQVYENLMSDLPNNNWSLSKNEIIFQLPWGEGDKLHYSIFYITPSFQEGPKYMMCKILFGDKALFENFKKMDSE